MRSILAGLLILALTGCFSVQAWNERLSTAEDRALAGQVVELVRRGDFRQLAAMAEPQGEIATALTPGVLAQLRQSLPPGPVTLQAVGSTSYVVNGVRQRHTLLNYEAGGDRRWAIVQVVLNDRGDERRLAGVTIRPSDRSPVAANRFTLSGKTPVHYLWLALMAAAAATSLTALVLILRTRALKRKWLWAAGSVFGVVSFRLDWTTGAWDVLPTSILLFGAAAGQSGPLLPWVMSFAVPAVAILFLLLRATGRLKLRTPQPDQAETGTP